MQSTHPALVSTLSDKVLASRLRAGDRTALAVMYARFGEVLCRLAYRITGTREDAEDVVQDLFLGLSTALQHYQERETLLSWLRMVTARRALMQVRSRSRTMSREAQGVRTPYDSRAQDEQLVTSLALRDAVERLPEILRQVFVLSDVEGFSHAEIGALLGISAVASRTRRHRAVALLQTALRSTP